MKKLSRLKLKEAEMTPNEIKQILGGFGSGDSGASGAEIPGDCNGITGSCSDGCKPGCSPGCESCKDGCKTNKG